MRAVAHPPRPKWPWIILAAAIVILIAVVIVVVSINANRGSTASSTPTPAQSSPRTAAPNTDAAPTGCLGGTARDAAMVLAAQKKAAHTSAGAIEVAAAILRFSHQYPYPTAADAKTIEDNVLASSWPAASRNLVAYFASDPPGPSGVAAGESYYFTTLGGVWLVNSYTPTKAVVSIGTGVVANGALSPSLETSATLTMVWQNGEWKQSAQSLAQSTTTLFQVGQPFTGGC